MYRDPPISTLPDTLFPCTTLFRSPGDDLLEMRWRGFRGEALPSIGAVSRLSIVSRQPDAESAWSVEVEGGKVGPVKPAAAGPGTRIEVRDLFYAEIGRAHV